MPSCTWNSRVKLSAAGCNIFNHAVVTKLANSGVKVQCNMLTVLQGHASNRIDS